MEFRNNQPIRNGIHDVYRREEVSPPHHENFVTRRAPDFDEEDHSVPQQGNVPRSPDTAEARKEDHTRYVLFYKSCFLASL